MNKQNLVITDLTAFSKHIAVHVYRHYYLLRQNQITTKTSRMNAIHPLWVFR